MTGRRATTDVRPGRCVLSVGDPEREAPPGWRWVPLSEVATMATGHTPSRKHPEYWGGDIPWMNVGDARPFHGRVIHVTSETTNPIGIENSAAVVLPEGTVCLSRTGSIGYAVILGRPMATSQGFVNWICGPELLPQFLQQIFLAEHSFLHEIAEGVAHTTIYFPEAKAFHVCIPSVGQQRCIAAEIEKQFSRLDEAGANLKRVKANLKRFRAAALATAFDADYGWGWKTYANIGEVTTGFTPPTADPANFGGDIPFFKPTDLDAGENVVMAREHLSAQGLAKGRRLPAGSVLVTCIGATIGKTGLARVACATNQQINAVSPRADVADSRFVYWWTVSPAGQQQIIKNASATTLPILNKSKFAGLKMPLPSLAEQHRIVAEVDRRVTIVRELEAEVDANLARSLGLRRSVLARAFAATGALEALA